MDWPDPEPRVIRCPSCEDLVGVPESIDDDTQVRCPLCSAAFSLGDAPSSDEGIPDLLREVVPVGPHEAESEGEAGEPCWDALSAGPVDDVPQDQLPADATSVTDRPPEAPQVTDEPAAARDDLAASPIQPATDAPAVSAALELLVRCPHCEAESKLGELVVAASGQRLDEQALAEALGVTSADTGSLQGLSEAWRTVDAAPSFEFGPASTETTGSSTAALTRRRRSDKSPVGQIIGVLLGGLLALPIAYYVLNLIRGEQFDWLSVPLPFARHTYKHLPQWWPEWARPHSQDTPQQESPDGQQQPGRPASSNPKPGQHTWSAPRRPWVLAARHEPAWNRLPRLPADAETPCSIPRT